MTMTDAPPITSHAQLDGNGRVIIRAPQEADALKCWQCGRALLLSFGFSGRIEIACRRCRAKNVLTGKGEEEDTAQGRVASVAHRAKRLELMGFTSTLRPSTETIIEMMESKWKEAAKIRAQRSAYLAIGLRFDVLKRDGFVCRYCGFSVADGAVLHVDHVIPRSKGGPTTIDNLVTACIDCNLGKSDKDL